jgi:hypothetical protein
MFTEPGNANLEPVPPLVPEPVVQKYVAMYMARPADKGAAAAATDSPAPRSGPAG